MGDASVANATNLPRATSVLLRRFCPRLLVAVTITRGGKRIKS
jgi:hypothetical protein